MGAVGVLLLAVTTIAVLVLVAQYKREREVERTREMAAAAARLEWRFTAEVSFESIPGARRFQLFSYGHHRRIRNFMSGRSGGHDIAIFDYEYVTGTGRSYRLWLQTVVHVHTPGVDYPRLEVRPEHVLHRVGSLLGYQDIDLERHPEFSRTYLLRGPDEAAVRGAFTPGVVEVFARNAYTHAEASGPDLFFWHNGHTAGQKVPALLDDALDCAARLQAGPASPAG